MRIGDSIQAGLNTYDPSPYLNAQARATSSIGSGIAGAVNNFGDILKDQREKKNETKAQSKLIESYMTLFPDSANALAPIKDALMDEDTPISERHAIAKNTGELISSYLDKSRSDALLGLQVKQLGLDERRVRIAEEAPERERQAARSTGDAKNAQDLNEAISKFSAISEAELPAGDKIPQMKGTADLIMKFIGDENGPAALNAVDAYSKIRLPQIEKYLTPETKQHLTLGGVDASGQPINIDAFMTPSGSLSDVQGNPLNDGGALPPRNDAGAPPQGNRVPPLPTIGVRPAATPAAPKTPTEVAIEEEHLRDLQARTANREIQAEKENSTRQAALQNAQGAVALIDTLEKHPGFGGAVGASLTPGFLPATDRKGAEAIIDQLKGQAFLNSIQQLRGMGALSDAEGAKLQQAAARLNPNQSEKDFKIALEEYKSVVKSGIERLKKTLGDTTESAPAVDQSASDRLRSKLGR